MRPTLRLGVATFVAVATVAALPLFLGRAASPRPVAGVVFDQDLGVEPRD